MKTRYTETERYKQSTFRALPQPPHTPTLCPRSVDSTANTNLVLWASHPLALKEVALSYSVDPHTLETLQYDSFSPQTKSKPFTAHPKIDSYTNEFVVLGY
jgi:carotenoid cleavage dioxygenase-like enzyme